LALFLLDRLVVEAVGRLRQPAEEILSRTSATVTPVINSDQDRDVE
jgi:hypothetical protein